MHLAITDTPLGRLLVAASARGVALVALGDDDAPLLADAARRAPGSVPGPEAAPWLAAVAAVIDAPELAASVALDVRGTPFQKRVWDELRRVPPGETVTYAGLAARLGLTASAARAVAGACARNPAALLVPCHRVVGANGALTGYRWGVGRKAELLRREGVAACGTPTFI